MQRVYSLLRSRFLGKETTFAKAMSTIFITIYGTTRHIQSLDVTLHQPRSQGLSSLPPLVVGNGWSRDHPDYGKTSYKHCINPLGKTKENPVENKVLTGVFQEHGNNELASCFLGVHSRKTAN